MLEQLLEQQLPELSAHLRSLSLSVPFVTTQWFLCLFLNALCVTGPGGHPSFGIAKPQGAAGTGPPIEVVCSLIGRGARWSSRRCK